jgi:hypothetical protein
MQKIKLGQRGASILEVVIMSGVMVAMMTGFMTLIGHETKNITYLEDKLSRVALESELRMQMGGTDFCQDLLGGIVMPQKNKTVDVTQNLAQSLHAKALDQVFQKRNAKTVYDQLELKKVLLEDSSLIAPNSSGTISIDFYPERIRKGGGPESLLPSMGRQS